MEAVVCHTLMKNGFRYRKRLPGKFPFNVASLERRPFLLWQTSFSEKPGRRSKRSVCLRGLLRDKVRPKHAIDEAMKTNDDILRELSPAKEKEKYTWDVYGVNSYCPSVKVTNWWYYREGFPKDCDAFHPPGNTIRSSYNRLGSCKEDASTWTTETADAMKKGLGDEELAQLIKQSQPRPMLTFLSYPRTQKVRKDLLDDEIRQILPSLPRDLLKLRYSTTYKSCYKWIHESQK